MTAAAEIQERYADAIERGRLRARAEANRVCDLCAGDHRTNECATGERYIRQIVTSRNPSPPPTGPRDLDRERRVALLAEAVTLIQSAVD